MIAYYNEIEPYAAQWLRNLIAKGLIARGDVDERDIRDVTPAELAPYTQCHFFAGIGGWSLALRLAGWSDDRPVWSGSPPCQDVSVAGASWRVRSGLGGERTSLVRPWLALVERARPGALYFENVPGIAPWLAEIEGRLAGTGATVTRSKRATSDLAGPHLRRRVWIAAHRDGPRFEEPGEGRPRPPAYVDPRRTPPGNVWSAAPGRVVGMADGFPARVAAIRAFGNSIDPWVAAEFIRETMP